MPTAATTAPSAGTAAHAHDVQHAAQHDAHVRLWRAAWYVALRSGLDARGSLPPVEPWATDGCGGVIGDVPFALNVSPLPNAKLAPGPVYAYMGPRPSGRVVERDEMHDDPPYAEPTTGSQWCGVLHPDAPDDAVVRETNGPHWRWVVGGGSGLWAAPNERTRSDSPATPASIPHTRDDGRVEWRDDPAEFRLETYRDERGVPGMLSHPPLPRARLLGGTHPGDPPSPWWEGDLDAFAMRAASAMIAIDDWA